MNTGIYKLPDIILEIDESIRDLYRTIANFVSESNTYLSNQTIDIKSYNKYLVQKSRTIEDKFKNIKGIASNLG